MLHAVDGGLALALLLIIREDFSQRRISLSLLVALLVLSVSKTLMGSLSWREILENTCMNIGFLLFNFMIVFLYFRMKKGRRVSFVDTLMGAGDLLFLAASALVFPPLAFFFFFFASLVLALITELALSAVKKQRRLFIPFASYMGCVFLGFLVLSHFPNFLSSFNPTIF